jgi:hypothetical protein
VGKIRLATTPPRNPLVERPSVRRRARSHDAAAASHDTTFEITIDFVDHAVIVRTADGRTESFELGAGCPSRTSMPAPRLLGELDIDVEIKEEPFGVR